MRGGFLKLRCPSCKAEIVVDPSQPYFNCPNCSALLRFKHEKSLFRRACEVTAGVVAGALIGYELYNRVRGWLDGGRGEGGGGEGKGAH